jgi:hypothetical protein
MMDEFDSKRGMIKHLIDMLKKSAADEVSPDAVAIKKVTLTPLPKENVAEKPGEKASKMSDGGMAAVSDEPEREMPSDLPSEEASNPALENLPGPVEDEDAEKSEIQAEKNEMAMDEDEDNNSSAFDAFIRKRKK